MVVYNALWALGAEGGIGAEVFVNCNYTNLLYGDLQAETYANAIPSTGQPAIVIIFITVTKGNANFSFGGGGASTSPEGADLWVMKMPNGIN